VPLEPLEIQLARLDAKSVAGSLGRDPVRSEPLAKRVHLHLERIRSGLRRALAPERVDQPVTRDDVPGGEEQARQQPRLPP
jgi:hypothetical protein